MGKSMPLADTAMLAIAVLGGCGPQSACGKSASASGHRGERMLNSVGVNGLCLAFGLLAVIAGFRHLPQRPIVITTPESRHEGGSRSA